MSVEYCKNCGNNTSGSEYEDICNDCDDVLIDGEIDNLENKNI